MKPTLDDRPGGAAGPMEAASAVLCGPSDLDAFYREIVGGMRCGILSVDRRGRLVIANDLALSILELPRQPQPGEPVDEALSEHPQLAQVLVESFGMSSLPNRAEIGLRTASGKEKTIGFTMSFVGGVGSGADGAAMFFKDLTHVEHREEQERLKDRLAALGQMSANLAHEIRNPLAGIEVSCSLLKRRLPADGSSREILDKIVGEVRRLNRTITSSLEFVRPLSLSLAPGAIEPLLEEALQVAEGRRGRAGIRIERRYLGGLPRFLMDRGQLRQVFENLFLNAMEAIAEEGTLTIETSTAEAPEAAHTPYRPPGSRVVDPFAKFDHYVTVRVSDTGCGISDEHKDKLFYPFFTTKKQGSGVGLSMARKIVDSHRGLIDVLSVPGGGATFTVRIPLVATAPEDREI